MSINVKLDELSSETKQKISNELEIKIKSKYGLGETRYIYPFQIKENDIYLPFSYASRILKIKRPVRENFPKTLISFDGILRPEQKEVRNEAIKKISKNGSILLSMYCGFGKTVTGIKLACETKFKTLIIVNKLVLIKQWKEGINIFCPTATVQKLTVKSIKKDCDFYIMNAQNIEKMGEYFFSDIGCVIVDEAHLIMAETLSRSLQYVQPRYLIGLTATPYRPDGLNILLELYFGKFKIIRKLWREHKVYKISTNFKPTIEYTKIGKVNWGVLLDSQANNIKRNELIIKLIEYFQDRNFLVLVKRISQGEYLEKRLNEIGENVTSLLGSNQEFEITSRILIGTCQKVGVGFDHPKLDSLILASDVEEYFVQYLGRVFRTKEGIPLILDLVDNYSILNKHYLTRKRIYKEHGGHICNFDLTNIE